MKITQSLRTRCREICIAIKRANEEIRVELISINLNRMVIQMIKEKSFWSHDFVNIVIMEDCCYVELGVYPSDWQKEMIALFEKVTGKEVEVIV